MRFTLDRFSFLAATAVLIVTAWSSFALADCPFVGEHAAKTRDVLMDGVDAFRNFKGDEAIARELFRKSPIVATLTTKALLQHMSMMGTEIGEKPVSTGELLKNVNGRDGGKSITITSIQFPASPELGIVYKVQIGYLEADAAKSDSSDAFSERLAVYYFKKLSYLRPVPTGAAYPTEEYLLLGSMLDSQLKSCFIK